MELFRLPCDDEIGAAYDQGKEAAIALFHQTVGQLAARVQALEDRVTKNSRNSGKPPFCDGLCKPAPKSLRQRHGKKGGGQPEHEGHTLKAIAHLDHGIVHPMQACAHCQTNLEQMPASGHEKRQVFDIPSIGRRSNTVRRVAKTVQRVFQPRSPNRCSIDLGSRRWGCISTSTK